MRYSAFHVGDGLYSVPIMETEELARAPHITPVPASDRRVAGLVNLRGKVAVALDLRECLEAGKGTDRPRRHMVIMESGRQAAEGGEESPGLADPVVLLVDRIHGIVDDEGMELQAPPAHVQKPFVKGIIQRKDRLIVVLSIPELVQDILRAGA
jgi:purine-binding chemotaxis protein CheW